MKTRYLIISVIMGGLIWITSCRHDSLIDLTNPTVTENCDPDTVYFKNDVFPMIISNCAKSGCHDGSGGGEEEMADLSSYNAIMNSGYVDAFHASNSKMIDAVKSSGGEDRMPPSPNEPLTPAQIATLEKWINQGARNNECSGGACDTNNVTYAGTIADIMSTYCTGCHSGGSPSASIDLTSYSGVAAIAADGSLLSSVMHEAGYVPMPYGGEMIPDCKIDELRIWVENNYPNN